MYEEANHPAEAIWHDYVDGLLAETQATAVTTHLASCPRCREEVATLSALAAVLATVEEVELREDMTGAVLSRLAAQGAWAPRPSRRWLTLLWSLQGVVAVALLIFLWPVIERWSAVVAANSAAGVFAVQRQLNALVADWLTTATSFFTAWQFQTIQVDIPPDRLLLLLGLILAAWLVGNGVLLRPSGSRQRLNGGSHG